jgi:hypothetical protein
VATRRPQPEYGPCRGHRNKTRRGASIRLSQPRRCVAYPAAAYSELKPAIAASQKLSEEEALQKGMEAKAVEFVKQGAEIYKKT